MNKIDSFSDSEKIQANTSLHNMPVYEVKPKLLYNRNVLKRETSEQLNISTSNECCLE